MSREAIILAILAVLALSVLPLADATSFVPECNNDSYRTAQADAVLVGTVTDVRIMESYPERGVIALDVEHVGKGVVKDSFTIQQTGLPGTGTQIPSITLEWNVGETWRVQAKQVDGHYELVCGEFGRQPAGVARDDALKCAVWVEGAEWSGADDGLAKCLRYRNETLPDGGIGDGAEPLNKSGELCAQVITYAKDPQTGSVKPFPTPCDVPDAWTVVDAPDPQLPDGECEQVRTEAMNPETEEVRTFETPCDVPEGWVVTEGPVGKDDGLCAQVITYAKDLGTGDVQQFPTPCDVPEGWETVDEPQPAKEPETPAPSVWQRFVGWLQNIFG